MNSDNYTPGPSDQDLQEIEQLTSDVWEEPVWENPLADLFDDVMSKTPSTKLRKPKSKHDPIRAAEAESTRLRALYTNPDNWKRTRGLALIDRESKTFIGNYSEYIHINVPSTRKLIREHGPIAVDGVEEVSGYLGPALEAAIRNVSYEKQHTLTADLVLDELSVEAPAIQVQVQTRLNATLAVRLAADTQFASTSGNTLLHFPAGTDIFKALSMDCKISIRRMIEALE